MSPRARVRSRPASAVDASPSSGQARAGWFKISRAASVGLHPLAPSLGAAGEAGIVFNPGPEWACDGERAKSHLRLCFALPSKEQIREGVAAFARVCWEQTGIPAQSANVRHQA